jgi:HSP20 family protein
MTAKDVDIEIKNNVLVIQGEKKTDSEKNAKGVLRKERSYGFFYRTIPFLHEVDSEKVNAKMKDGVLKLKIEEFPEQPLNTRKITIIE